MDFSSITNSSAFLINGALYTLKLTLITTVGGLTLGTLLALARLSSKPLLREPARLYVNFMRSVPLVLILFWFFLLMPEVLRVLFSFAHPVMIGAVWTAILPFVLLVAGYCL